MARILVVSRAADEGRILARLLRRDGHRTYLAKSDASAHRLSIAQRPELLVLATPSPSDTMRALARSLGPTIRSTPAIAVVHEEGVEKADPRETPGLLDLLPTPFSDDSFLAHIDALLRVRKVLYDRADLALVSDRDASVEPPARKSALRRIMDFMTERVAPHKKIRFVEFIDAVPKSAAGKILRKDLKARA